MECIVFLGGAAGVPLLRVIWRTNSAHITPKLPNESGIFVNDSKVVIPDIEATN